jgi:hypothetical protein
MVNPLGVIIKNVSSSFFCASRLLGREEQKMTRGSSRNERS